MKTTTILSSRSEPGIDPHVGGTNSMGEFFPPEGALDVAIPRTASRIVLQTCLLHLFADYTYTYLCELVPRLRYNSFPERCIQVLLLWHMPEYIFLQMGTMLIAHGLERLDVRHPLGLVQFASLAGVKRFKSRDFREDLHGGGQGLHSWENLKAGILAVALMGCWAGAGAYVERFGISYHAATDVGMLGIDHRNGWTAFAGLIAGTTAIGLKMYFWVTSKDFSAETLHKERGGAMATQHRTLRVEKEDDDFDFDACEVPLLNMSLDHAITLVEGFTAAVMHQILLIATHRSISIIYSLPGSLILIAMFAAVAMKKSRPALARIASTGLKTVPMLIIAWTIVEPSLKDLNELYDASATILHPWTFRWLVTDRFDRLLRPFI